MAILNAHALQFFELLTSVHWTLGSLKLGDLVFKNVFLSTLLFHYVFIGGIGRVQGWSKSPSLMVVVSLARTN